MMEPYKSIFMAALGTDTTRANLTACDADIRPTVVGNYGTSGGRRELGMRRTSAG